MSSYKEKKTVKNQRYFNEDCQDWLFESAFKNWLTKDKAQQKLTAMFFINQLNYLPAVDLPLQITEKAKKKKNRFLWYILSRLYTEDNGILFHKLCSNKSWCNMYGLLIVDSGFFVKPNDDINDVFSTVFCDNPTASEFHMARIKIM